MAITVASSSTAYSASGTSLVITKPTGLAVGDLMLAQIRNDDGGSGITLPSGWSSLSSTFSPFNFVYVHYKYADSGDVAASNFTWTSSAETIMAGGIIRITGASPLIGSVVLAGGQSNTATPSIATGVTPTRANSLIVQFWFYMQNTNDSLGGYAIATSNPTWTEQYDVAMEADAGITCAWAVRPQTTSTGAWSCTGGTGTSDYNTFLVSINEALTTSVAESVTLTESHKQNITSTYSDSVALNEAYNNTEGRIWVNDSKPSTTWTQDLI